MTTFIGFSVVYDSKSISFTLFFVLNVFFNTVLCVDRLEFLFMNLISCLGKLFVDFV